MRVGTAAVLLILLGITLPLFITERSLGILEKMIEALMEDSASLLLSASMAPGFSEYCAINPLLYWHFAAVSGGLF